MEQETINMLYMYSLTLSMVILIVMAIIFTILFMSKKIGQWGIFAKAGVPEWKSIIPVYNQITLLKICKLNPWFVLLYLDFIIPAIGYVAGRDIKWITIIMLIGLLVYRFLISIRLGQSYKKGDAFSFFMAILPSIFFPIIGCSKNEKFTEVITNKKNK